MDINHFNGSSKIILIIYPDISNPKLSNGILLFFFSQTITEIFSMRSLLVLGLGGQFVLRGLAEDPRLVYNQSIYSYLFDDVHPKHGIYNKNSPPIRKDDMTRYYDGMEIFEHSIDKFVDHHCDPYVNFLESKFDTIALFESDTKCSLKPDMISKSSEKIRKLPVRNGSFIG